MNYISISAPLIENSKHFLTIKKTQPIRSFLYLFKNATFVGWGRKKSGLWATKMARFTGNRFLLLEDGFIRSLGLGVEGSPSFSMVKDDRGIYYDATTPSRLEHILNSYQFQKDKKLLEVAQEAMGKMVEYQISKYNNFQKTDLSYLDNGIKKVLIVAQTAGDSSLEYGLANEFTTQEMINDAMRDNPDAEIYIKIHPDVLCGKKESDIVLEDIPKSCKVLQDNVNPIELLQYFDKIYAKTSGMGMEGLILGREVHCYGMPFYAGWGLTKDKIRCTRRDRKLSIEELFAGAYILYSEYYNPYLKKKTDIISVIDYIFNNGSETLVSL